MVGAMNDNLKNSGESHVAQPFTRHPSGGPSAASHTAGEGACCSLRPPHCRRRWVTLVLLLVVFVLGGVCGAGVTFYGAMCAIRSNMRNPEQQTERIMRRLDRRLELTDEQEPKIRAIVQRQQADMMQGRLERFEQTDLEMRPILTPEQQEKWAAVVEELRQRWMPGQGEK